MAKAIVTGMISSENFKKEQIFVFDKDTEMLKISAESLDITAVESNEQLVDICDCIILAVKPNALQQVLLPIKEKLCKANPLVISIAAGKSIEILLDYIGYNAAIIRVMPNINAIAAKAVSGYAASVEVTEEQIAFAKKLLSSFGKCVQVDEDRFSAYSAIAGCSPAYAYLFVDALSRVGVKYGLSKSESLEIVTNAVINSEKNLLNSDENSLNDVVLNAIDAAYRKDKGM